MLTVNLPVQQTANYFISSEHFFSETCRGFFPHLSKSSVVVFEKIIVYTFKLTQMEFNCKPYYSLVL